MSYHEPARLFLECPARFFVSTRYNCSSCGRLPQHLPAHTTRPGPTPKCLAWSPRTPATHLFCFHPARVLAVPERHLALDFVLQLSPAPPLASGSVHRIPDDYARRRPTPESHYRSCCCRMPLPIDHSPGLERMANRDSCDRYVNLR